MDNILIVLLSGVVVTGGGESNKTSLAVWTIKGGLLAVVIKTFATHCPDLGCNLGKVSERK